MLNMLNMLNLKDGIATGGPLPEEVYLALETNRLIEFDNGTVEVLPAPTDRHQAILAFLFLALRGLADIEGASSVLPPCVCVCGTVSSGSRISCIYRSDADTCEENASGKEPTWWWRSSASVMGTENGTW